MTFVCISVWRSWLIFGSTKTIGLEISKLLHNGFLHYSKISRFQDNLVLCTTSCERIAEYLFFNVVNRLRNNNRRQNTLESWLALSKLFDNLRVCIINNANVLFFSRMKSMPVHVYLFNFFLLYIGFQFYSRQH